MKNFKRKLTTLVVSLALLITTVPANAYLAYAASLSNPTQSKVATSTYQNPIYKGLNVKTYSPSSKSSPKSSEVLTIEEAGEYLKQQMVKRTGTISFTVDSYFYYDLYEEIFNLAIEDHLYADSSEGDYLYRNFYQYHANAESNGYETTITYTMKYLSTYSQEQQVNREVANVLDDLDVYDEDEYTKIKTVHDYIVKNIEYDYSLTKFSAYNAIVEKNVVCHGFSLITYKMLKDLGVGVRFLTGNNSEHSWNLVKIDDLWYNTDNTWDENLSTSSKICYDYFLKGKYDFPDHIRDYEFDTYSFNEEFPTSSYAYEYTPQYNSTLSISNYNYPTTIIQGNPFTLTGTITSNYLIDVVGVRVIDSDGDIVPSASKEVYPYSYSYSNLDSGIKFGTLPAGEYTYQVYASDESGNFEFLVDEDFTVKKPTVTVSNITGLKYTNTTSSIKLTWKKAAYASGYEVWMYKPNQDVYVKTKTITSKNTNYFSKTGLSSASMYRFKVRAYRYVNGVKYYGNLSDEFIVATKPLTPKVTVKAGTKKAILKWSNTSSKTTGYEVYRATSKYGTYKKIKTTSSKNYTNTGLTKGKYYYYKVRAYRILENGDCIYGSFSAVKSVKVK